MTIGNKTTAYQYNKNDELLRTDTLHTDTEKNDVVIYKNDKNGNQLATVNRSEIPAEAKDTSYIDVDVTLGDNQLNDNVVNHYNALNQLTETLTKNYKVSFTYDAEGLRTGKTVNGEKTVYVWDGDQVVMELSKGGAVQKRYIRGNDLVYADKGENTEKTYYVTDMHGNVVQLLDESGNVTKTYEYDSFGNEVKPEKKDENPYRYCGEYYDKETEEVYLRARYYEPGVGRFITRDTYTGESDEPLSLHLYTYCENDGVNMVDPSGHNRVIPGMPTIDLKKYKKNIGYRRYIPYTNKKVCGEIYTYITKLIKKRKIKKKTRKFDGELKKFKKAFVKNKSMYKKVAKKAKVPAQLVAAIHYRENTSDCLGGKFDSYLHNGDMLGKETVNEPKGIFYPKGQFVRAAQNAIDMKSSYRGRYKLSATSKDFVGMCSFALTYNGKPESKRIWQHSPYVFSGTNINKKGKYTDDSGYDPNVVDKQVGVFLLIDKIYTIG